MMPPRRNPAAGFTLVEVLVALVIFAVIGVAGFTMLDQVLRTQSRTDGRLERLAAMQRTMHLLTLDFMRASPASLERSGEGEDVAVSFAAGAVGVRYRLAGDVLVRDVTAGAGDPVTQALLADVSAADWAFHDPAAGWTDVWPPADGVPSARVTRNPQAVALTLTLAEGQVRRVALLPAAPE